MNFTTEALVHGQTQTDSHQVQGGPANVARERFKFFDELELVPRIGTSEITQPADMLQIAGESLNPLTVATLNIRQQFLRHPGCPMTSKLEVRRYC